MVQRVLVVDDDPTVRQLLRRWLEGWGYQVQAATCATEALEMMLVAPAPIIFCDIHMPGHDGIWLVERIRAKWRAAIIMATAVDDLDTVQKSERAGAVDYLTKPFGRETLLQALDRATAAISAER